jgi:hypothetical protein
MEEAHSSEALVLVHQTTPCYISTVAAVSTLLLNSEVHLTVQKEQPFDINSKAITKKVCEAPNYGINKK